MSVIVNLCKAMYIAKPSDDGKVSLIVIVASSARVCFILFYIGLTLNIIVHNRGSIYRLSYIGCYAMSAISLETVLKL